MTPKLNRHLLDGILNLAITDTEFLSHIAGQVDPLILPDRITSRILSICLDYYLLHKEAPQEHFHDELVHYLHGRDEDEIEQYTIYVERLRKVEARAPYIERRLNAFIKTRCRERAYEQCANLVMEGKLDEADAQMYKVLKAGIEVQESGLDYLNDMSGIQSRGDGPAILMPTGVSAMDRLIGGFQRGWLVTLLGGYKGMKSWAQCHFAMVALRHGLKVALVTHEMSQEEYELRSDMMLTAMGTQMIGRKVEYPLWKHDKLVYHTHTIESVYKHTKRVESARIALRRMGGRIFIKKYPMGQCTYNELEGWLGYLENQHGFMPDVVINDYIDIMELSQDGDSLRHGINDMYIKHKGLADERNILVITASQVNTDGLQRKNIQQKHVAEDKRKIGNVDCALAVSRTPEDEKSNIARLSVIAGRSVPQGMHCVFSSCPTIGQFCISSWMKGDYNEEDVYGHFGTMVS